MFSPVDAKVRRAALETATCATRNIPKMAAHDSQDEIARKAVRSVGGLTYAIHPGPKSIMETSHENVLPISEHEATLVAAVMANSVHIRCLSICLILFPQCLVIIGETGSGKTTKLPQYLHRAGLTKSGPIVVTQVLNRTCLHFAILFLSSPAFV